MRARILLGVVLGITSEASLAEFFDGGQLYRGITAMPGDSVTQAKISGYIRGVQDAGAFQLFCPPANATEDRAIDIVKNWTARHPERFKYGAYVEIQSALAEAWPCPWGSGQNR